MGKDSAKVVAAGPLSQHDGGLVALSQMVWLAMAIRAFLLNERKGFLLDRGMFWQ